VLVVPPLLGVVSLARLGHWLGGRAGDRRIPAAVPDDHAVADWVTGVLRRLPGPWRYTCLRRAAVLYFLLRRAGRPVELWVGVRRVPAGALDAHAWLVRDGRPYLESDPGHAGRYTVIARFPEPRPAAGR
jgi:hypothetical protein